MSLSNIYGTANDEESKELLRHAIKIGLVSMSVRIQLVLTSEFR